jgi:S1-C subfamily serine protease
VYDTEPLDLFTQDEATPPPPPEEPPASRPPRRWWPWLVGLAAVALVVVGVVLYERPSGPTPLSQADVDKTVSSAIAKAAQDARNAPPDAAQAFQTIQPSLVLIEAQHAGGATAETSSGAGVVINAQGAILTARHVVAGASTIQVTYADGTKTTATVSTDEPQNDIAVLASAQQPQTIVPAVIGGGARVGDAVFAVGHPLGLVDSLTAGVVSGLNRSIPIPGGTTLNGLIQFDAAVNPGSSGGPLLNRNGQVIGIVSALANPSQQGYFIGIGFAVPIGTAAGGAGGPEQ